MSEQLKLIIEAALMAAGEPLSVDGIVKLFPEHERPVAKDVRDALKEMQEDYGDRAFILKELATGYCFQVRQEYASWIIHLWEERPPKYSRALLETLAIIAYRQPLSRADIENIRGVAVSTTMMKTLMERDWVRLIGHRDVPGKPGIYGTTKAFLDYFNLKNLNELPSLKEIKDIEFFTEKVDKQLELDLGIEMPVEAEQNEVAHETGETHEIDETHGTDETHETREEDEEDQRASIAIEEEVETIEN